MRTTLLAIVCCVCFNGCSLISTALTPAPVVDAVARGGSVARIAEQDPPTGEDLKAYLKTNRELWEQLEVWFDLKESK